MRTHKLKHKKCTVRDTGLFFPENIPFLAASPDGFMTCSCGEFLIEIKCLFSNGNKMPKTAGKMQKILIEDDEGTLKINPNHEYYYQMPFNSKKKLALEKIIQDGRQIQDGRHLFL